MVRTVLILTASLSSLAGCWTERSAGPSKPAPQLAPAPAPTPAAQRRPSVRPALDIRAVQAALTHAAQAGASTDEVLAVELGPPHLVQGDRKIWVARDAHDACWKLTLRGQSSQDQGVFMSSSALSLHGRS